MIPYKKVGNYKQKEEEKSKPTYRKGYQIPNFRFTSTIIKIRGNANNICLIFFY